MALQRPEAEAVPSPPPPLPCTHGLGKVPVPAERGFPFRVCLSVSLSVCVCGDMAMLEVSGYQAFVEAVQSHKGKTIFAYFTGSKDKNGVSWCPDCVQAEPIVRAELDKMPEGAIFIYCQTGARTEWKNVANKFRTELNLTGVPTLMKYGTTHKLVEGQLFHPELVQMLFADD